ncbi:MAG: DUF1573 domain-containing protein [Thermoguttaceae bacterium]
MSSRLRAGLFGAVWVLGASMAGAQEWATKMFETTRHDFGTVAAGAKTEYEFVLKNIYVEDVHIASVRSSCGCTSPYIKKEWLKTYEKGAIVAVFNTRTHVGSQGATLTVTIDRPYFAQVQLHVSGYIRRDVVLTPGSVEFGAVDQGTPVEKTITVSYAGRSDWQIVDVKSANPHISARVEQTGRSPGQVSYNLIVRMDQKAPAGPVREHLILVTNDRSSSHIPVPVQGVVQSEIVVSPATLFLGRLQPGQKVTKQLVVKGKRPFRIVSITADGSGLEFGPLAEKASKQLHIIPVTFVAGQEPGKISQAIRIETDLGQTTPVLSAYAVVVAP